MNSNKIYKLIVTIITVIIALSVYSTCYADNEKITNDLELNSYSSFNNEIMYGSYIEKNGENILLSIKATDYNLPSNLYDFKDDIRLRITYTQEDYKVYDCKVINYKTGEIIENLSEENINKLFNIEYGKSITEKNWIDAIKLSELKENEIYKYTANSTTQFPKIENDIGKNCIIYIREKDDKTYEKKINMYKEVSSSAISASFNEYNSGDTFSIMYRKIENDELLKLIKKDEIIYLSNYNDGNELKYQFEKYIYNDTEKNITIHTKDTAFGVETSNSVIIEKGKIYGFNWMIDSATISYLEDINNEEDDNKEQVGKTEEENTKDENEPTEQTKGDNTQATGNGKLPQTGKSMTIISVVLFVIIIAIISYKKYYK